MHQYYAYDADGDIGDDCAELGAVDAATLEDAEAEAKRLWPDVANLRVA